jgi:pseudaminic acid synthase
MPSNNHISRKLFGADKGVYVIAELSANHNQSFDEACRLVVAAADAGADAIKLQTYTADTITLRARTAPFLVNGTLWAGRYLHDLYGEAHTPWDWQPKLKARAEELGLDCFSSPFDPTAVDFLETMDVPAYKIASFELVDIPLIEKVARTGKPAIMSTGMATLDEITEAVNAFHRAGGAQLALLKCTSAYPSPASEMNLSTIPDLARRFGVRAGLSDHTLDLAVPVAAVALGARVIEKHLTISRSVPGPDSAFSLEPHEFKEMVAAVRTCEAALGEVRYEPTEKEVQMRVFRRSLFATRDIAAGEIFTTENVRSVRPNHGLHTRNLPLVLGTRAAAAISFGTPLAAAHLEAALRKTIQC